MAACGVYRHLGSAGSNCLHLHQFSSAGGRRSLSTWIRQSTSAAAVGQKSSSSKKLNVEKLFIRADVQQILASIVSTNADAERVFHAVDEQQAAPRPDELHLMSHEELQLLREDMARRALPRLQTPPFLEPPSTAGEHIDKDEGIAGFDDCNFVFLDTSALPSHSKRVAVVRQPDGVLRRALDHERSRLIRTFYPTPHRAVEFPKVFSEPYLPKALAENRHKYVLDYLCHYFEPDETDYINLTSAVYEHCDANNQHELLWSTRHFGGLVFYLVINDNIERLLLYLCHQQRLSELTDVVRLHSLVHSGQTAIPADASETDCLKRLNKFAGKQFGAGHPISQRLKNWRNPTAAESTAESGGKIGGDKKSSSKKRHQQRRVSGSS